MLQVSRIWPHQAQLPQLDRERRRENEDDQNTSITNRVLQINQTFSVTHSLTTKTKNRNFQRLKMTCTTNKKKFIIYNLHQVLIELLPTCGFVFKGLHKITIYYQLFSAMISYLQNTIIISIRVLFRVLVSRPPGEGGFQCLKAPPSYPGELRRLGPALGSSPSSFRSRSPDVMVCLG